jgi:hypothetical protein
MVRRDELIVGNQATLRRAETTPPAMAPAPAASSPAPPTTAPPASLDVWGLRVDRSMCACKEKIRRDIAWANTAAATYAACDTPANPTGKAVETCFEAAHPEAKVEASTSPGGAMTLPPPSADPCKKIANKSILVHETMHARHADEIARKQGPAFLQAWLKLTGDPDRLDKLRVKFPAETAAFDAQWDNGSDWAKDEMHSYTWHRRFLEAMLQALNRIC